MAIECDDAAYEVLKREHSRLTGEAAKAKAELTAASAAMSTGDEMSVDEEVEAALRIAGHLSSVLQDSENREKACDVFRRLGLQIGLMCDDQKFGPKRIVGGRGP